MRAFSLKEGELAVRDLPMPEPGSGQILVKRLACAICASDHHHVDHPEAYIDDRSGMRVHAPDCDVVMGHEYCAEIVEFGPDTKRKLPIGTRVTGIPLLMLPNGEQRITGYAPDAPGGYGDYFLMNEFLARPVPEGISSEIAAVNDALAVGWYYSRAGTENQPKAGTVPLVIGLGAIGISVVMGLKNRGAGPIIAADFSESRRALALKMGADHAIDPAEESPYDAWRRIAWGSPEEIHDRVMLSSLPRQVVYECAGKEGVLASIIENCEIDTRILSAGGAAFDNIPATTAHIKGVNLQYGGGPAMEDWYGCLELVLNGTIDPRPLVGETVSIEQMPDAFDRARLPTSPIRIVLTGDPS